MRIMNLLAGTALLSAVAAVAPAQTPGGYSAPAHESGYGTTAPAHPAGYGPADAGPTDLPPGAHAGQCFAHVLVPIRTEPYEVQVVDKAEHQDARIVAAVYGDDEKDVVIKEGRTEFVTIPATYKTQTETVTVRAASQRTVTIPAVYEHWSERVLVEPATTAWKKGVGLVGYKVVGKETKRSASGDILCLVEVPAKYEMVDRQRLVKAEETKVIDEPAVLKEVTTQVIDTPARVEEHKIPPEVQHMHVRRLISAEHTEMVTIPATYRTVTKFKVVGGGNVEWREILCDTNTTRDVLIRVQVALADKGFYKGRRNGVVGPDCWDALIRFQRSQHLPEGQLTMETVQALGIKD